MADENDPQQWSAMFGSALLIVTDDDWRTVGDRVACAALALRVDEAVINGWPELAGWDIDTTPGWDDEWTYLRLLALGADSVTGPFPQEAELTARQDPDVIVG